MDYYHSFESPPVVVLKLFSGMAASVNSVTSEEEKELPLLTQPSWQAMPPGFWS